MHLKRICILLLLNECFTSEVLYVFNLSDLCHLRSEFSLIICLNDLSVDVSGMLKSPSVTVLLLITSFMFVDICFMCLDAPGLGVYIFITVMSFCWIDHSIIM